MSYAELSFQFAKDVATQLITISSALIGISITFVKDSQPQGRNWLRAGWLFYIVSILFGVVSIMALTGALEALAVSNKPFQYFATPIRIAAGAQILLFAIATICFVIFGWRHQLR